MVKIFKTNKITGTVAVTIPKAFACGLSWQPGDRIEFVIGKDKTLILKKIEEQKV